MERYGLRQQAHPLGDGLCILTGQVALSTAPAHYREAVTAWRGGGVERHVLTAAEIEELVELARSRYGADIDTDRYPIRFHLHVPFAYGVFTLRTEDPDPDQFSTGQVAFLQRLVEVVSIGYGRYREFLYAERDRAAQQVRAEVQGMQASDDIVGVMILLWEELRRFELDFNYMSISVRDPEEDTVHLYSVRLGPFRDIVLRLWSNLLELRQDVFPGADFAYQQVPMSTWDAHHTEYAGFMRVGPDQMRDYYERIRLLYGIDEWPDELLFPIVSMLAAFPGGRISVSRFQMQPEDAAFSYTPEELEIVEGSAEALGLGFARFLDFRRLEQRNRELEIDGAVERVQNAVQGMKTSSDILSVMPLLFAELECLGLEFHLCSANIVERDTGRVRVYILPTIPFQKRWKELTDAMAMQPFSSDTVEILENEAGPVYISDLPGAEGQVVQYASVPLDAFHGRLQQIEETTIVSRTEEEAERAAEEYLRAWKIPPFSRELWIRSVLRTPFSGGTIAISYSRPDQFTEEEARILERFAEAFSMGYTRYLDFRRLERQNRALEEANAEIREATRRKSEFLRRMSHDLRTPMNAIIGYTRLLSRKLRGQIDERQQRNLANIDTSARNLLNLINEILDLSRVEAGRIEVKPQEADLRRLAEECAAAVESLVGPDVEFCRQFTDVPATRTDPEILRKVLMNLLGNAVKFTERGSITLSVRSVDGTIELAVADTGVGIPAADLPYIFEEFRQVERQGSTEKEGTGLGLAIAKKSVELLGGTLVAESEPGRGTTFALRVADCPDTRGS